jgi:hypothetical protein
MKYTNPGYTGVLMVEFSGECGNTWVFGPWIYGTLRSSDSIGTLGFSENPAPSSSCKWGGAGCLLLVVCVLRLFLKSYGRLVAVSAPLVMPLCDSDIPMNVPLSFVINHLYPRP